MEILNPSVARRDCQLCLKYQYNENKGEFERSNNGVFRLRLPSSKPLCQKEEGCPKGTPTAPKTLWPINRKAYTFYLECKAIGQFPDDPYVRWLARVIAEVEQQCAARQREVDQQSETLNLLKVLSHGNQQRNTPSR